MDGLVEYTIPVKGLGSGMHQFDFQVGRSFFDCFENSPVTDGDIDLTLFFDKRSDMYILQFDFKGTVKAECDRCLEEIDLPIADSQQLLVKFSQTPERDEAEVVFIHPETQELNVAQFVYEFICLALPLIKTYDCENDENRVCNEEMLAYLDQAETTETDDPTESNPIWDDLKNLDIEN